jgi:membrane protein implicated in regulation of membrane protease activity
LLARAYNINYALLLLVFLLYNNMPSNILKDPRVAIFFVMSLILGSITAVMPLFTTTFDIYSVWLLQQFELLLDINISAFVMIILYLLEHAFFRKRGKPRKIKNMSFFDWLKGLF